MRLSGRALALTTALVAAALSMPAAAGAGRVLDSKDDARVVVSGNVDHVAAAGDVNGDGHDDYLVAGCAGDGAVRVLFGPAGARKLNVDATGHPGFRITGPAGRNLACYAAGAGDVDGDGLGDVIVGAPLSDPSGRDDGGSAFVVFGKADEQPVALADFAGGSQGDAGFRIDGGSEADFAGNDVAGLGDVNGDGLGDVAVGAPFAGATYVVFGRTETEAVDLMLFDLNAHGVSGYRVSTPVPPSNESYSVGGGGDVNGDGLNDLVVGTYRSVEAPGAAYVVVGKATPDPVDVTASTPFSYTVRGFGRRATTGHSVSVAGDVDGDGLSDVLVGAPVANCCGVGNAYVVFGRTSDEDVELSDLGRRGFRIRGARPNDETGVSLAPLGDLDRDGRDDFLVGAPFAEVAGRRSAGVTYVIYGKSGSRLVDLGRMQSVRGFRILGPRRQSGAGSSVAGADLTGDGRPDVVVGAQVTHRAYVVPL